MEQRESILLIGGISMGFPKLGNLKADSTLPLEIHISVVNTRLKLIIADTDDSTNGWQLHCSLR
jgi:hypothetical protein